MFTLSFEPKDAQTALRYARSAEKAAEIIREGYGFWPCDTTPTVFVCKPGRLFASYWIDREAKSCDCGDFVQRGSFCKHLLAWEMIEAEIAREEAQCAEIEGAETAEGCDPYARF